MAIYPRPMTETETKAALDTLVVAAFQLIGDMREAGEGPEQSRRIYHINVGVLDELIHAVGTLYVNMVVEDDSNVVTVENDPTASYVYSERW